MFSKIAVFKIVIAFSESKLKEISSKKVPNKFFAKDLCHKMFLLIFFSSKISHDMRKRLAKIL